jgi:hypothetical protein
MVIIKLIKIILEANYRFVKWQKDIKKKIKSLIKIKSVLLRLILFILLCYKKIFILVMKFLKELFLFVIMP